MRRGTHDQEFTYQLDATESVSDGVLDALADISNAEHFPVDEWPPLTDAFTLYDAVDPDALDALFRDRTLGTDPSDYITFVYNGYEVTVTRGGEMTVRQMTVVTSDERGSR